MQGLDFSDFSLWNEKGIPSELTGDIRWITDDPTEAKNVHLRRGQYRVELRLGIPLDAEAADVVKQGEMVHVPTESGERKRLFVYKADFTPLDETEEFDGVKTRVHRAVLVFRVLDNPVWVVPAIKAVTYIGTGITSWFVVDKIGETAEGSLAGSFVTVAASVLGIWAATRVLLD